MKKTIILLFVLANCTFAQEPNPYSFFPSAVGDVWEYYKTPLGILRYEIVKDSILPDGSKLIYYNSNTEAAYRIDTAYNVYEYPQGYNWLSYKLNADSGDTWIVDVHTSDPDTNGINQDTTYIIAKALGKFNTIVFGDTTTVMQIRYFTDQKDTFVDSTDEAQPVYIWDYYLVAGVGIYAFWDIDLGPTMILRGCIIGGKRMGTLTSVFDEKKIPLTFQLYQNYPNPFNPVTTITYQLPKDGLVTLKIFDILGNEVRTLVNDQRSAGTYTVQFFAEGGASSLSSGMYVYQLRVNEYTATKKMLLVK
ncbi:MAG: T9SS type A sorting domain-containing protein [Ignavibacteriaceae bacterium]